MERSILFTAEDGTQDVNRYSESEMSELFSAAQLRALMCGEEITYEKRITSRTVVRSQVLDLVSFANKHRGQRKI